MENERLQEQHIQSFAKLSLRERLAWAFSQNLFFSRFMNAKAKKINKNIRKNGKKYFSS